MGALRVANILQQIKHRFAKKGQIYEIKTYTFI